jgi:hypothetical protein
MIDRLFYANCTSSIISSVLTALSSLLFYKHSHFAFALPAKNPPVLFCETLLPFYNIYAFIKLPQATMSIQTLPQNKSEINMDLNNHE